jgi:hypothetical protein
MMHIFNTTIYSNDDRYRGLKGLRTLVFMNSDDMRDRSLGEFDLVDITSIGKDGSRCTVYHPEARSPPSSTSSSRSPQAAPDGPVSRTNASEGHGGSGSADRRRQ